MTYNQQEKYKNKVSSPEDQETEIAAYGPLPSKAQLDYHKEELAAFIHYGMIPTLILSGGMVEKILKTLTQLTLIQTSGLRP